MIPAPHSSSLARDPLWRVSAYRLAHSAIELAWTDVRTIAGIRPLTSVSDQLYRSVASIAANLAEGFSRGSPMDRARFYEYSLGSAREALVWYEAARHGLSDAVVVDRMDRLSQIRRLMLVMVSQQRRLGRERRPGKRS